MKKKKIFQIVISVLMIFTLITITGCANSDSDSNDSDGDIVTITAMTRWIEFNELFNDVLIPEFEDSHPHIRVENQTSVQENYTKSLQAAVNGENLPDIFASHGSLPTYTLQELDVVHKLNDVVEESKYAKEDFEKGMWTSGSTTVNGDIYALPLFSNKKDARLMYYNKNVLEEAGLTEDDVPKTWSELVEVSGKIQQKTDAYGTYLEINTYMTSDIIRQMATPITPEVVDYINYHTGEYEYHTEGNIESIKFLKKLIDEGINEPSDLTREVSEGSAVFAAGKAAFYFNGPAVTKAFDEEGFEDYGVAPIPVKDGTQYDGKEFIGYSGASLMGGLHVNKDTKHYEEVKEFLKFLIDKGYPEMIKTVSGTPPVPDLVENTEIPDSPEYAAAKLQNESYIRTPDPVLNNENAILVKNELSGKGVNKSLTDVTEGYISGQITDLEGELEKMTEEQNEAFEKAIKKVQDDGDDIDQSAWEFPDWEPFTAYEK